MPPVCARRVVAVVAAVVMGIVSSIVHGSSAQAAVQVVEFRSNQCAVCQQMQPMIDRFVEKGYPLIQIDADEQRQLADQYQITSLPTFVVLVDQREVARRQGALDVEQLLALFREPTPTEPGSASAGDGQTNSQQMALQASVRLRVEDSQGTSYGSGTVIDVHGSEALAITCGHIFRDSQGKGRILVDTYDGSQAGVEARLVSYDLNRDVGLVSFATSKPLRPVAVGDGQHVVQPGQEVFSIGCDRGARPSLRAGRVTAINKYLGPANLVVSGQPVDGRSGGGLFDAAGTLIGICNCADPQDNEGLYAALPSIHAELDRARLSFVYQRSPGSGAQPTPELGVPPKLAAQSAAPSSGAAGESGWPSLASTVAPASQAVSASNEVAAAGNFELICIVRSKNDPHTEPQTIVVADPSRAMLEQLQTELARQASQRTTSWEQRR